DAPSATAGRLAPTSTATPAAAAHAGSPRWCARTLTSKNLLLAPDRQRDDTCHRDRRISRHASCRAPGPGDLVVLVGTRRSGRPALPVRADLAQDAHGPRPTEPVASHAAVGGMTDGCSNDHSSGGPHPATGRDTTWSVRPHPGLAPGPRGLSAGRRA